MALFQKTVRLITDDLTPSEMRALLRAAQHVFDDMTVFAKVHPNLTDRKCALSAAKKLTEAEGEARKKRKGVRK